jgi:signal peptidase
VEASGLSRVPPPLHWTRRSLGTAASGAAVAAIAVLAALALGLLAGYRSLIVRSGSMEPSIRTGDLILTKQAPPTTVRVGQIVTFHDPSRKGELLTHRVVSRQARAGRVFFVTRGDANSAVERWSVAADGTVGEFSLRLPLVGYGVSVFTIPVVRLLFVSLASFVLGALLIRWIWARPR